MIIGKIRFNYFNYFLMGIFIAACAAFFCCTDNALAVSACPGDKVTTQPDGTKITYQMKGDEYFHTVSEGKFTFAPCKESSVSGVDGNTNTKDTVNDGIVHVNLDMDHGKTWYDLSDVSFLDAFAKALPASDPYVDFSQFDTDSNGTIAPRELSVLFKKAKKGKTYYVKMRYARNKNGKLTWSSYTTEKSYKMK